MRHLRPRGTIVDIRPDGSRNPRVLSRGRVIGELLPHEEVAGDDAGADAAVAHLVRRGMLRRGRRGLVWHQMSFESVAALAEYVRTSPRYASLPRGTLSLARRGGGRVTVRRAVKYEVLSRTAPAR
ncbi:MAG TPA: hypothetical protein VFM93_00035 [Candidatus Limnocylindria bacterium]|nr:hypothetical protein [Candidatus Limnocylindria bacterium]